ncbi:MAG TPA: molybdopterin-dependent oxidoreductase, partial [Burkholderiales bacterium]|nr:molybdopterin-dependent oxidoreductase [Burkholderiales bacterium]
GTPAGKHAKAMLEKPLKAYLLLNTEVELDCHNPRQAVAAMRNAELVVAMSAYRHKAVEYAHVLLPIAPFTETAGTFINTEGRAQSFNSTVKPLAEARPAWKVLRVLGNLLGLAGFEQESIEQVRAEILPNSDTDLSQRLDNRLRRQIFAGIETPETGGLQRIGEVPIYSADAIVRRAGSLQKTRDAGAPAAWMPSAIFERLKLREGDQVRLTQEQGSAMLVAHRDDTLPQNCVRVAGAHPLTAELGAMFGEITVERAA